MNTYPLLTWHDQVDLDSTRAHFALLSESRAELCTLKNHVNQSIMLHVRRLGSELISIGCVLAPASSVQNICLAVDCMTHEFELSLQ
jgi:hypothetical protein